MIRSSLALTVVLALAASVAAQTGPAQIDPPIATEDLEIEGDQAAALLEEGQASIAASARSGSLVVWEKQTPCADRDYDTCLRGQSTTSRTSTELDPASLTLTPRDDAPDRTVLRAEDGRASLSASVADLTLRPNATTVQMTQDEGAPEDLNSEELSRGIDIPVEGGDLTMEGPISIKTVGTVVQVQTNASDGDPQRYVTGLSWEERDDGFYTRTVRIAAATIDGGLSAAWDGSLDFQPKTPTSFTASQAEVDVVDGQLGQANASTGPTTLEDVEATVTGIAWQDDDTGHFVGEQGAQAIADPEPPAPDEGFSTTEVVGAGSAAALAVGLTAYYWPRVSWLGASLLAPLYSRIEKDELFENETREELYETIQDDPGIHAHALADDLDIGWGTTVYHLRRLERNGFVNSEKRGRYRRFFPASGFMERQREVLSVLQNETTNDIAELVLDRPGLNQSAICEQLDISPSLANWHLNRLIDAELVDRERRGRTVHYTPGEAWEALEAAVDGDPREVLGDAQAA